MPVSWAVIAVLAYRAFAFWLPTLPGAVAYLQLRRTVQRWGAEKPAVLRGASESGGIVLAGRVTGEIPLRPTPKLYFVKWKNSA